jgi:ketosteroid isomerase-like protein
VSEQNVETVRGLWRAFGRGGVDAVLRIADPDIEWVPHGGGGGVFRGHEGLREYMQQRDGAGGEVVTEPYSFTDLGEHVLVYGHYRAPGDDRRIFWLYSFRDGLLVRFEAFDTQAAALRAAGV